MAYCGLPTPSRVLYVGFMPITLLLLLAPRSCSWVLAFLYLIVHNLSQLHLHAVNFSSVVSLYSAA